MPSLIPSQLGDELYELMCMPEGATASNISTKKALMGLLYVSKKIEDLIREEAGGYEAAITAEHQAEVVRQYIKQATEELDEPLGERDHTDMAERGRAARVLLALETGTETLTVAKRRSKAAREADIALRTMTRERPGFPSWQRRLMNAIASKMWECEVDSALGDQSRSYASQEQKATDATEPFARLYLIWQSLASAISNLTHLLDDKDNPELRVDGRDRLLMAALMPNLVFLAATFERPTDDWAWDGKTALEHVLPPTVRWLMFTNMPMPEVDAWGEIFGNNPGLWGDWASLVLDDRLADFISEQGFELIGHFPEVEPWLGECECMPLENPTTACPAHLLIITLEQMRVLVEREWVGATEAYKSPAVFGYIYHESWKGRLGFA
ncbi:MAG TPA: hypothetical protein VGP18_13240 [Solirubrobacteraceae bacterium]|jgi:hypothetical protein|nr:hypothetical protein [Solirubrobacteraceae bacterium]